MLAVVNGRYLKRIAKTDDGYALLPANDAVDTEGITSGTSGAPQEPPKKEGFSMLAFWK